MADTIKQIMSHRSDGRLPDRTEPATRQDYKLHIRHIADSVHYNLRHAHDHLKEMQFSYKRLKHEEPALAKKEQNNIKGVLKKPLKGVV